ncbi:MAG: SDR family NAD(P)-dependent oxidoreductase [Anaerolineae bacterium]|nr:SDR family NAD(P)-dependent oxidoreductase [Anaerolineae bacterium]
MRADLDPRPPFHAFVTGADRGLGLALCTGLLRLGWRVFAGQHLTAWHELAELRSAYPDRLHLIRLDVTSIESAQAAAQAVASLADHLDLLINNAGVNTPTKTRPIREAQDYDEMKRLYDVNALGSLRAVEALLPLMERGTLKRMCFVSSEAGSIGRAQRKAWYGYCMSKAALNMATRLLFNYLRPDGYTFRVYHPGWIKSYISGSKGTVGDMEPEEAAAPALNYFLEPLADEDQLVMRDWQGQLWEW